MKRTLKLGSELAADVQEHLKTVFIHRFTREHKPFWALGHDKPHFKDDAEWLANTSFPVTKSGAIDRRSKFCNSNPMWPQGKPGVV